MLNKVKFIPCSHKLIYHYHTEFKYNNIISHRTHWIRMVMINFYICIICTYDIILSLIYSINELAWHWIGRKIKTKSSFVWIKSWMGTFILFMYHIHIYTWLHRHFWRASNRLCTFSDVSQRRWAAILDNYMAMVAVLVFVQSNGQWRPFRALLLLILWRMVLIDRVPRKQNTDEEYEYEFALWIFLWILESIRKKSFEPQFSPDGWIKRGITFEMGAKIIEKGEFFFPKNVSWHGIAN